MSKIVPRVLLIGVGRFGVSHLDVLQKLQSQKLLSISGVVVKTKEKKRELEKELAIPVYTQLTPTLLRNVDGVDIVTPYPTHYSLTKKILPYANVFVEKPIAEKEKEALELARLAKKYKKTLMVGHIYRYHPVTQKLRKLIGHHKGRIRVEAEFISPLIRYNMVVIWEFYHDRRNSVFFLVICNIVPSQTHRMRILRPGCVQIRTRLSNSVWGL